ncbi:hypothetical protein Zmor_012186 [Zophobas morio]|uniref:Uncharacterized protein n=1 Tax=Zophobas morio TaxID=2755281 RepID=A0AA38LYD4_9CUCU|nr:hypothetical protein Zmor_012186 [Zophobas morio]
MSAGLFGSLLGIASMFDTSSSYNPLISTNTFLYDKIKDFLFYSIAGSKDDSQNIGTPYFRLVNMRQDGLYGKISNGFNLDENASSKLNSLDDNVTSTTPNSKENPLNAIVSYRFAKGIDAEAGDVVRIYIGNTIKIPVYLKITAIDHNDTFMTNITADVDTFMHQVLAKDYNGQSQLDLIGQDGLIFNSVVSQNTAMLANIDLQNIAESMKTIKIESPVLNVALGKNENAPASLGASIMGPILNGMLGDYASLLGDFATEMTAKTDTNVQLLNNISMSGISSSMGNTNSIAEFTPFKITLALVNQISSVATMIMSIFIVLDAVMLLIILVVIMNIVVDESSRIILTMRAIGYKNRQIN